MAFWEQIKKLINSIKNDSIYRWIVILITAIPILYGLFPQHDIKYEKIEFPVENLDIVKSVHVILLKNTGYSTASDVKVLVTTDFYQLYNSMKPKTLCRISDKSPDLKQITYLCDKLASGAEVMITVPAPTNGPNTIKIEGSCNGDEIKEEERIPLEHIGRGLILGMPVGALIFLVVFKILRRIP